MKTLSLFLGVSLLLFSCGDNTDYEVGNKTTMEVNEVFDAGDIVKGEKITAVFTIKNTGDYPLVIGEVKGSCSCTVADYPEDPIAPGKEGKISAHVNTDQVEAGLLNKSVRIVANTNPSVKQVLVKANIIRK